MSAFWLHVCENGHDKLDRYGFVKSEFCEICGASVLEKCPTCNNFIMHVDYGMPTVGTPDYTRPLFCKHCGKPYPWTAAIIEAATMALEDDDILTDEEKSKAIATIPDLIVDNPKTTAAANRMKKILSGAGNVTKDVFTKVVSSVLTDVAKELMGLQ